MIGQPDQNWTTNPRRSLCFCYNFSPLFSRTWLYIRRVDSYMSLFSLLKYVVLNLVLILKTDFFTLSSFGSNSKFLTISTPSK